MYDKDLQSQAFKILKASGVVDCHCDTICNFIPSQDNKYLFSKENNVGHIDLPRLEKGNIRVQFFAVCSKGIGCGGMKETFRMIELYHQNIEENNHRIGHVSSFSDIRALNEQGKIAAILTLEGGEVIDGDLIILKLLYRLGVRSLSLTWNYRNQLADGILEEITRGGLTSKGREVIKIMESMGMIVDLAHLSSRGFFDAMSIIKKPPLVSHANAGAICANPRNLKDEQLKLLAENKGVIGITLYPIFITDNINDCNLNRLLDHFVHIASLIGVEHLGLGSDFDGIDLTMDEVYDCTGYHKLIEGLISRGFSLPEVELIIQGNVLKLLRENIN